MGRSYYEPHWPTKLRATITDFPLEVGHPQLGSIPGPDRRSYVPLSFVSVSQRLTIHSGPARSYQPGGELHPSRRAPNGHPNIHTSRHHPYCVHTYFLLSLG